MNTRLQRKRWLGRHGRTHTPHRATPMKRHSGLSPHKAQDPAAARDHHAVAHRTKATLGITACTLHPAAEQDLDVGSRSPRSQLLLWLWLFAT